MVLYSTARRSTSSNSLPALRVRDALGTRAEALASQQLDILQQLLDTLLVPLDGSGLGLDLQTLLRTLTL